MKFLFIIVVSVFVFGMLIMILFGGGVAWLMNVKTDVNDPKFAQKFQENMSGVCVQRAKSEIARSGQALDYQQEALVKQVCDCDMKAVTKILAKKGAKTPVELQSAYKDSEPEINAAFQSCAAAYGVQ
jgi:hypothetical protein